MKRKDRAIVAVILAAALVAGLVLVRQALNHAAQAQAASLASAQFNGGKETAVSSPERDDPQEGEETASAADLPASDTEGEPETTPPAEETGEAPPAAQTGGTEETPSAGGGATTLAALSDWMMNESSGALAAQSKLQAENALAAGIGTADDALRRTFAQSQAESNDTARRNQLEEEAAALGLAYLKCRDMLALREEETSFYQSLEETVSAQVNAGEAQDTGQEEQRLADLQTVQSARASAELAMEEAKADLEVAIQALNSALGNPYGTEIEVTDNLSMEAMPSMSGDEAAAQALEMRNEIKEADYQLQREQETLNQLRYEYAPTSPEVLEQQAAVKEAQAACSKAMNQVESDVRDRLTRLELQAQELEMLSAALEKSGTAAPETAYVLEGGQDGTEWNSNLSALMEQWTEIASNRASLIEGTAQWNLDVLCFQHAVGVGCTVVTI